MLGFTGLGFQDLGLSGSVFENRQHQHLMPLTIITTTAAQRHQHPRGTTTIIILGFSAPVNVVAVGLLFGAKVVHELVITFLLARWLVQNLDTLHATVL